jgi:hypothetical protein
MAEMYYDHISDFRLDNNATGFIYENEQFYLVSTKENNEERTKTYEAVFANSTKTLVVCGKSSGKGLGRGGAKWYYTYECKTT